jgi:ATP synthase protein I
MTQTPDELGRKIREMQNRDKPVQAGPKSPMSTESSKALRMGTDFTAALVVGVVLGYWIDRWLHTKPFGIIIFLFLGFAAGFMNIYRAQTRKTDDTDKG